MYYVSSVISKFYFLCVCVSAPCPSSLSWWFHPSIWHSPKHRPRQQGPERPRPREGVLLNRRWKTTPSILSCFTVWSKRRLMSPACPVGSGRFCHQSLIPYTRHCILDFIGRRWIWCWDSRTRGLYWTEDARRSQTPSAVPVLSVLVHAQTGTRVQ